MNRYIVTTEELVERRYVVLAESRAHALERFEEPEVEGPPTEDVIEVRVGGVREAE